MFGNQQYTLIEHISCEMITPEDQSLRRFVVPVEERVFPCRCCLELGTAIKRACLKVKETLLSLMIGGEDDRR